MKNVCLHWQELHKLCQSRAGGYFSESEISIGGKSRPSFKFEANPWKADCGWMLISSFHKFCSSRSHNWTELKLLWKSFLMSNDLKVLEMTWKSSDPKHFFPNPHTCIRNSLTDRAAGIILFLSKLFPYHLMLRPGFKPMSVSKVAPTRDPWRMLYRLSYRALERSKIQWPLA